MVLEPAVAAIGTMVLVLAAAVTGIMVLDLAVEVIGNIITNMVKIVLRRMGITPATVVVDLVKLLWNAIPAKVLANITILVLAVTARVILLSLVGLVVVPANTTANANAVMVLDLLS